MKHLPLLIAIFLVACSPASTSIRVDAQKLDISLIEGDTANLPDYIREPLLKNRKPVDLYSKIESQAVLISRPMLLRAGKDLYLRNRLVEIAHQVILLVHDASVRDVVDTLVLDLPRTKTTTTEYAVAGIRIFKNGDTFSGGVLFPTDQENRERLLEDIGDLLVQVNK